MLKLVFDCFDVGFRVGFCWFLLVYVGFWLVFVGSCWFLLVSVGFCWFLLVSVGFCWFKHGLSSILNLKP